jgi:nucleoside-diphosphate-sugar epimerase
MSKLLTIGGSGFLSGTMVREALRDGHEVWTITRGQRPLPDGVKSIVADRKDRAAFAEAVKKADARWDLVVDCIGFNADDAKQDVECFAGRTAHLVFISTDFVLSPFDRPWKVDETYDRFHDSGYATGKRGAEEVLLARAKMSCDPLITILRPGHIYGPGSLLGCLPLHGRDKGLIDHLRAGSTLSLVGGGYFLQSPVFAADLWRMAESCPGKAVTHGQIYFAPGPDVVESRVFYRIIAELLGAPKPAIDEVRVSDYLREQADKASFCAHRVYATEKAAAHGLTLPSTPLRDGLRTHVESMVRPA